MGLGVLQSTCQESETLSWVIRSVRNEQHYFGMDWDSESLAHDATISRLKDFRIKTVWDD